jgi:hypothetical protein
MLTFVYTIPLYEMLPYDEEKTPIETYTGEIEAPDLSTAKSKAWVPIRERVKQLEKEKGIMVGCRTLRVKKKEQTHEP